MTHTPNTENDPTPLTTAVIARMNGRPYDVELLAAWEADAEADIAAEADDYSDDCDGYDRPAWSDRIDGAAADREALRVFGR